eukprot:gene939-1890_t
MQGAAAGGLFDSRAGLGAPPELRGLPESPTGAASRRLAELHEQRGLIALVLHNRGDAAGRAPRAAEHERRSEWREWRAAYCLDLCGGGQCLDLGGGGQCLGGVDGRCGAGYCLDHCGGGRYGVLDHCGDGRYGVLDHCGDGRYGAGQCLNLCGGGWCYTPFAVRGWACSVGSGGGASRCVSDGAVVWVHFAGDW